MGDRAVRAMQERQRYKNGVANGRASDARNNRSRANGSRASGASKNGTKNVANEAAQAVAAKRAKKTRGSHALGHIGTITQTVHRQGPSPLANTVMTMAERATARIELTAEAAAIRIQKIYREHIASQAFGGSNLMGKRLLNAAYLAKKKAFGNRAKAETRALAKDWFTKEELIVIERLYFSTKEEDAGSEMMAEGILDASGCVALMRMLKIQAVPQVWQLKNIFKDMVDNSTSMEDGVVTEIGMLPRKPLWKRAKTAAAGGGLRREHSVDVESGAERAPLNPVQPDIEVKVNCGHLTYELFLEEVAKNKKDTFDRNNLSILFNVLDFDGGGQNVVRHTNCSVTP